ncbi:MAG TPA: hypothetical protein VFV52_06620 [Bacilli bacterium]|nr:hypothetical protein [Bacilli bacterium]
MSRSEIKVKRRDGMSVQEVAALLRRMAEQIEAEHTFALDGLPVMIGSRLVVERKYKKEGKKHAFRLDLEWDEEWVDQMKLEEDEDEADDSDFDEEEDDLPEGEVPTHPLDLPGSEDAPRTVNGERNGE